jgi:hypothetical protein
MGIVQARLFSNLQAPRILHSFFTPSALTLARAPAIMRRNPALQRPINKRRRKMKNLTWKIMLVGTLLLGSTAYAQQTVNVRAKVPFDFVLGDKVYPSGEYAIQTVTNENFSLWIRNDGGEKSALLPTDPERASEPAEQSKLVFHHIGNAYFLFQIWVKGSEAGRQFRMSNGEKELISKGEKAAAVIVAGNTTR